MAVKNTSTVSHQIKGPLPSRIPNYLAPLSPGAIKKQATTTIAAAYRPASQELDQQGTQAKAISDKRTADNKYYLAWLNTQEQAMQTHADAANQQLIDQENTLRTQQQGLYSTQAGSLIAAANARSGNVSSNGQSNAFNQTLTQNQITNEGLLNSAQQSSNETMTHDNDLTNAVRLNSSSFVQAGEQKQLSDLQTALTGIAQARSKLVTSEASDTIKEIARLNGIEIQKAQSNRDYGAAVAKLNLSTAETQSLIDNRAANTKLAGQRLTLDLNKAQLAQLNSDRTYKLDAAKYGAQAAKDLYERQHGLGVYKPAKGTSAKPPLTQTGQNALYKRIDAVTAQINNLITQHGYTPQQAYHAVQNGGFVGGAQHESQSTSSTGTTSTSKSQGQVKISQEGDIQILNAAFNLRAGGVGLSPGDVAALKAMGLAHPGNHYGTPSSITNPVDTAGPRPT